MKLLHRFEFLLSKYVDWIKYYFHSSLFIWACMQNVSETSSATRKGGQNKSLGRNLTEDIILDVLTIDFTVSRVDALYVVSKWFHTSNITNSRLRTIFCTNLSGSFKIPQPGRLCYWWPWRSLKYENGE